MENSNLTVTEAISMVNQLSVQEKEILLREIDVDINVHLDAIEDYGLLKAMKEVDRDNSIFTLEEMDTYISQRTTMENFDKL
jgi:hypothetical protein